MPVPLAGSPTSISMHWIHHPRSKCSGSRPILLYCLSPLQGFNIFINRQNFQCESGATVTRPTRNILLLDISLNHLSTSNINSTLLIFPMIQLSTGQMYGIVSTDLCCKFLLKEYFLFPLLNSLDKWCLHLSFTCRQVRGHSVKQVLVCWMSCAC